MKIEIKEPSKGFSLFGVLASLAIVVSVVLCLRFVYRNFYNSENLEKNDCSLQSYHGKVSSELEPSLVNLSIKSYPLEAKKTSLEQIANSEDLQSYPILVDIAKCKSEPQLQEVATALVLTKIKAQGNVLGARVLELWLAKAKISQVNPRDLAILGLLFDIFNKAQSIEYRKNVLGEIFAGDPQQALGLVSALVFDEGEEDYGNLLKTFLLQDSPDLNLKDRSIWAIMMSSDYLSKLFELELKEHVNILNTEDLIWVVKPLGKQRNSLLWLVVNELEKRNIFNAAQKEIIAPIASLKNNKEDNQIKAALLSIALGKADRKDFATIGSWYNSDIEKILLNSILLTKDSELSLLGFDILAGRSLQNKTAEALIRWLKAAKYWDKRAAIYKAIITLCVPEQVSKEELDKSIDVLLSFTNDSSLFDIMQELKQDKLILAMLPKVAEITTPDVLISLLRHKNKDIRIEAVKALRGHNEIIYLQEILDAYRSESNEEVLNAYRENHWVTENRGGEIRH